ELNDFVPSPAGCAVERRLAASVFGSIDLAAGFQQGIESLDRSSGHVLRYKSPTGVAIAGSQSSRRHDRSVTGGIRKVRKGAFFEQQVDGGNIEGLRGPQERRAADRDHAVRA